MSNLIYKTACTGESASRSFLSKQETPRDKTDRGVKERLCKLGYIPRKPGCSLWLKELKKYSLFWEKMHIIVLK